MKRTGLSDTSPEARRVLDEVYRKMPAGRKLSLQADGYRCERFLYEAGFRRRNPGASDGEVRASWNRLRFGPGPWSECDSSMDRKIDNIETVREVVAALDRLGIAYAIGGSWASSYYGEPRSTQDADITVEPFPGKESVFVGCFGPDYYLSRDAVAQAVRERRTFNIINSVAGYKVDVFIRKDDAFGLSVLARRRTVTEPGDPAHPLVMISPEDIILHKLEWYRLGGETSERQWLDILGVLRIQSGSLDEGYLDHWAMELKVDDLLAEARAEAAS